MRKKCESCGKEFEPKKDWQKTCFDCFKKSRSKGSKNKPQYPPRASKPDTHTNFQFDNNYLKDGYFEDTLSKAGEPILRREILDGWPQEIAKLLGNLDMKIHQLRRLFNKARGVEANFRQIQADDFDVVRSKILSMKRDVAYQVGRQVVPEEFMQFIDTNVELAIKDQDHFKGFLDHFESVLAYFVYYHREN